MWEGSYITLFPPSDVTAFHRICAQRWPKTPFISFIFRKQNDVRINAAVCVTTKNFNIGPMSCLRLLVGYMFFCPPPPPSLHILSVVLVYNTDLIIYPDNIFAPGMHKNADYLFIPKQRNHPAAPCGASCT